LVEEPVISAVVEAPQSQPVSEEPMPVVSESENRLLLQVQEFAGAMVQNTPTPVNQSNLEADLLRTILNSGLLNKDEAA